MQSIAIVVCIQQETRIKPKANPAALAQDNTPGRHSRDRSEKKQKNKAIGEPARKPANPCHQERLLAFGLGDLLAAVETGRRNVVAQMRFTRRCFDGQRRCCQEIMGTVHATL
jgi:hypothetical protein